MCGISRDSMVESREIPWRNHARRKNASMESRHGISRGIPWSTSDGTDYPPTPGERNIEYVDGSKPITHVPMYTAFGMTVE